MGIHIRFWIHGTEKLPRHIKMRSETEATFLCGDTTRMPHAPRWLFFLPHQENHPTCFNRSVRQEEKQPRKSLGF